MNFDSLLKRLIDDKLLLHNDRFNLCVTLILIYHIEETVQLTSFINIEVIVVPADIGIFRVG